MKKVKFLIYTMALLCFLFFLLSPSRALAYSPEKIIEDNIFLAKDSMTEAQVQQLLVNKGSTLANYKIPRGYSATYWISSTKQVTSYINEWIGPIGQEVNAEGWPVSRVIYQASQWYHVNPQVIISILEKESSMITDPTDRTSPEKFARMAWIMGYAYTESADPIVNVCDTSTNHNPTGSCAGVAMQIDWAAGSLENWFNKSVAQNLTCAGGQQCWPGKTILIDGSWVTIGNNITGPFYRYTPHFSWGGTFTWCMTNWFDFSQFVYNSVKISENVSLSDYDPAIGQEVSTYFAITNYSTVTFDIPYIALANWYNYPIQNNRDFGSTSLSLAPGETKSIGSFKRKLTDVGPYKTWVTFYLGDRWYNPIAIPGVVQSVNYQTHIPNIGITSAPIQLNPPNAILGQTVTASTTARNYEEHSISVDYIGIANWYNYPSLSSADYVFKNNVIFASLLDPDGGDLLSLSGSRTLDISSNNYKAWVAFCISGKWYEAPGSGFKYSIKPFDPTLNLQVTELDTSNLTPSVGEEVTGTVSIKNNTAATITIDSITLANWYNYPQQNSQDFGTDYSVTFNPNETKLFTYKRILSDVGYYRSWVVIKYKNSWFNLIRLNGQGASFSYKTHVPNIGITVVPIQFSPINFVTGQLVTAQTVVRNYEPKPIKLDYLGIANWYNYPFLSSADFVFNSNVTLASLYDPSGKDSHPLLGSTALSIPSKNYRAWVAFNVGGKWYEAPGSGINYSVN